MLNIFCFDHPLNKVVEYRFFILGAVQSVAELIEISVNIRMAYPGVSCSNPRFYLMYHRVESLEVLSIIAWYLLNGIFFHYRALTPPYISRDFRLLVDMLLKDT
ncbi:MAG: hypothetical protein ACJAWV_003513 [Flammeovirgaceae bacterium]|jgi:hypothetical protein